MDVCLSEFLEYASEVDVEFVRKSVRAIGRTAIKIDSATQKCIDVLLQLIKTKINYVVQEGIIVIKDIFRKFPNQVCCVRCAIVAVTYDVQKRAR